MCLDKKNLWSNKKLSDKTVSVIILSSHVFIKEQILWVTGIGHLSPFDDSIIVDLIHFPVTFSFKKFK